MSIGENIRIRRKELDMTLEDIASMVGISRQTMSRYETGVIGNIPSDKIELLAKALRTSPAYLMGWEDVSSADSNVITPSVDAPPISPKLQVLSGVLDQLNDEGQEKLLDYASDLVASGRYMKEPLSPTAKIAARGGGVMPVQAAAANAVTREFVPSDDDDL